MPTNNQSGAPKVNKVVKYGTLLNRGNTGDQPAQGSGDKFQVNPTMGPPPEWDYKTAKKDWNGNSLPAGAVGWTAQGEPYYGHGQRPVIGNLLEWAAGAWGRITEPLAGTGGAQLLTQGKAGKAGDKPNVGQTVARVAGEGIRAAGEVLSIPAYTAELGLGAGETARAATTESPLPDISGEMRRIVETYGGEYEGNSRWSKIGRWIRSAILETNPIVANYNIARFLLSPGSIVDKKNRLQAATNAARITYTAWIDPALRQEYIHLYEQGIDPYLVEQELKDPIAELAGQLIFDPLNLLSGGAFGKAKPAAAVADDVAKNADLVRAAVDGAEALTDAQKLERYQGLADVVRAQVDARQAVRTGLESRGLMASKASRGVEGYLSLTATGKRMAIEQVSSRAIRFLFGVHRNPDDAADMIRAVIHMTSQDADEVAQGIAALAHSPMGNAAYSDDMIDLGLTLRKMLENEDGVVDAERFLKEVGGLDTYTGAVEFAEKRIAAATGDMFPTISEMSDAAKRIAELEAAGKSVPKSLRAAAEMAEKLKVSPQWKMLARLDSKLSPRVNKINQMFADIYMGLNPGYAMRNLIQNYVHAFVDYGPGIFQHRPGGWLADATLWLGDAVSKKATQGLGPIATLAGEPRRLPFQRMAAWAEKIVSETCYGITVKRTMEQMLRYGRALPDIEPLTKAGLDPRIAGTILNGIISSKGNVGDALKLLRTQMRTGSVDAFRALEWASPSLVRKLKSYQLGSDNLFDAIVKAIGTTDKDGAIKGLDEIVAAVKSEAAKVAKEGMPMSAESLTEFKAALVMTLQNVKGVEAEQAAKLLSAIETTTLNSVQEYMKALGQYSARDPQVAELVTQMGGRWSSAEAEAKAIIQSATSEWKQTLALEKQAARAAGRAEETLTGTQTAQAIWDTASKDVMEVFRMARDEIAQTGEMAAQDLLAKGAEGIAPSLERAQAMFAESQLWDSAKYTDELGWFVGEGENATRLTPPYVPGTPASKARYSRETLPAVETMIEQVKKGLDSHWGETADVVLDENLERALVVWEKEAARRVNEARQIAAQVAEKARDFTLLDYTQKKGMDLALGYIFPYQFWYNRTYQNWMTRFIRNPAIIAGYAKYRGALEDIHAGSPDWWKYNVNTNELLGLDSENPLFFNLEATLNPLNGITGIDFDDPAKRVDWWTATIDSIGRFGPSVWTPISMATAASLYMRGETEAAARWAGRLFPQTATIKSALGLLRGKVSDVPLQGEFDPMVQFFSGGLDPYERKRVGRALGFLVQEGIIDDAEAIDAAYTQKGDVWNLALDRAVTERAPGQLMSFLGGVGLKARSQSDVEIDKFWGDYSRMWNMRDGMSPEEWKRAWNTLRNAYPFMDAVLLSRKSGTERDVDYAFNVLSRIAPGDSYDFAEWAQIPDGLMNRFWDGKGGIENWSVSDQQRFMAGIIDLAAVLDVPNFATKTEWTDASNAYKSMQSDMERLFGEDIFDRIAAYDNAKGETQADRSKAEMILAADPQIEEAQNYKRYAVMNDPLMAQYYSSIYQIQVYWEGQMYDDIEQRLGSDIWEKWDEYWYLKESGGNASAYKKSHPELTEYGKIKDEWEPRIAENVLKFGDRLRTIPYDLRTEEGPIAESLAQREPGLPQLSWQEWQGVLGPGLSRLIEDYAYDDEELPDSALTNLRTAGESLGIGNAYVVLQLVTDSLR